MSLGAEGPSLQIPHIQQHVIRRREDDAYKHHEQPVVTTNCVASDLPPGAAAGWQGYLPPNQHQRLGLNNDNKMLLSPNSSF